MKNSKIRWAVLTLLLTLAAPSHSATLNVGVIRLYTDVPTYRLLTEAGDHLLTEASEYIDIEY